MKPFRDDELINHPAQLRHTARQRRFMLDRATGQSGGY
jgi:hypothetical protein